MATSTERGRAFRQRRREEREALIAAGMAKPPRPPKPRPPVPIWNGLAFADEAARTCLVETRPPAPLQPVAYQTRPAGRGMAPAVWYCYSTDSGFLRPMSEAEEVISWRAAKPALNAPWPATSAEEPVRTGTRRRCVGGAAAAARRFGSGRAPLLRARRHRAINVVIGTESDPHRAGRRQRGRK